MKFEWFDPNKSFLTLKVVWVTVSILVVLSTVIAVIIVCNSELRLDLSYSGFNHFISVFRVPLAISALIIPIVALLAANHRSEQTKEQIRVTNSQNIFSNYYKHLEEFIKYLPERNSKELRYTHSKVFPDSLLGDYRVSPKLILLIGELGNVAKDLLEHYPSDWNQPLDIEIKRKYYSLIGEINKFTNPLNKHSYQQRIENENAYWFESRCLLESSIKKINDIEVFCKFSVEYTSPVEKLNLKLEELGEVYESERNIITSSGKKGKRSATKANEILLDLLKQAVN